MNARRVLLLHYVVLAGFAWLAPIESMRASGLLIPVEPDLPPLAMLNHKVKVTLEDQAAVTRVSQTFRNHTDRKLEATYVFPVPSGASVRDFAIWVDGKRVKGELLRSDRAKEMYHSIVRQTKNPALLDYVGTDLLSLRIFPVPPKGDQTVEVSFTAIAKREHDLVQYVYPLKTDRDAAATMEEFRIDVELKSSQPIAGIYSPSHEISINQVDDHRALVGYEREGSRLDRDFQLFYSCSGQDIGMTALAHRPVPDDDGYAMLLVSPRAELAGDQKVPRDIVFVVDTSGSMMRDDKMEQAKNAVRQCLDGLAPDDRFAVIGFATTVNRYRDDLTPADEPRIKNAMGWVADLYAGGGTCIHAALTAALEMRSDDPERMFTVVFFTDGQPTIGETDSDKILADIASNNSANTRIFSLGLGDDLNAVLLDQLAEKTRAVSTYVQVNQNIERQVSSFFQKIHHPVLANLKFTTTGDVRLSEVYPPQLPDLFHGDQLVVLARYQGSGSARVALTGTVGHHQREFVYDLGFADQGDDKPFVEELWARRKVGYLLDQIRVNGEDRELVDEVVRLSTNYGITTPYTSYLIMPDAPLELAQASGRGRDGAAGRLNGAVPPALATAEKAGAGGAQEGKERLEDFAKRVQQREGDLARYRGGYQDRALETYGRQGFGIAANSSQPQADASASGQAGKVNEALQRRIVEARRLKSSLDAAHANYRSGLWRRNQVQALGVDLAVCTNDLKYQKQLRANAVCRVADRNCLEVGGVWIDEGFSAKTPTVAIKAQSDAYFRILDQQPQMKEVFGLGNHVVWVAPSGTGLVIDSSDGKEQLSDQEIATLFKVAKSN